MCFLINKAKTPLNSRKLRFIAQTINLTIRRSRDLASSWFLDCSRNTSQRNILKHQIIGRNASGIKIQVSCDKNQNTLGGSSTILHPLTCVLEFEQYFLTSNLIYIWLNCCPNCFDSFHNLSEFWYLDATYLLFQNFILRSVARTAMRFGFLTVPAIFPTSYLIHTMEYGWTTAQSALILATTYLNLILFAILSLICFSKVLSEEFWSNGQEIWLLDS